MKWDTKRPQEQHSSPHSGQKTDIVENSLYLFSVENQYWKEGGGNPPEMSSD